MDPTGSGGGVFEDTYLPSTWGREGGTNPSTLLTVWWCSREQAEKDRQDRQAANKTREGMWTSLQDVRNLLWN